MNISIRCFKWLAMILAVGLSIPLARAGGYDLYESRIWTGRNGKTFRGTFVRFSQDGSKADIFNSDNRLLSVALENLSDADRKWLLESVAALKRGLAGVSEYGEADSFRPLPDLDRTRLPVINQSGVGLKESDCVPSAFCNFLLWWDQEKLLEIPKKGDFNDKAEWIHTRLARYCHTRNTAGTGIEDARNGFKKYFDTELKGVATWRFHADYDLKPENLARYAVGATATMLSMTVVQSNGRKGGHWVALVSADPGGRVVFHTWGARFAGTIEPLKESAKILVRDKQRVTATTYEIKIDNAAQLPASIKGQGIRFILDPEDWDGIFVIRPYLFAVKDKIALPPRDPLFDGG